jgi:putative ABC transport system ATP-binding protein
MTMSEKVVQIRNLGVQLGAEFAVQIEHLDMGPGEVVVLDAPSGAGKSTVLGLIAGAIKPIVVPACIHILSGRSVTAARRRTDYASANMLGFVLQSNVMVPYLTLEENIGLPLRITGDPPDTAWAAHLTGSLGLNPLLHRRPSQVSVGQRQRAALARALLGRPDLLLLDEPVSALDPNNAAQVETLIQLLAEEAGSAVILASHQAFRGAFAETRRVQQRMEMRDGVSYSLFSDTQAVRRQRRSA